MKWIDSTWLGMLILMFSTTVGSPLAATENPRQTEPRDNAQSPELAKLIAKAEQAVDSEDAKESFQYYQKAGQLDGSIEFRRRFASLCFACAERIRDRYLSEYNTSQANLEAAREGAMEDRKSFAFGKYKKFNPDNPNYKKALANFEAVKAKIAKCMPFYENAQDAYGSILRFAPHQKDFDAAGHLPLCMVYKYETNTRAHTRQLLMDFLDTYKASNESERALYERCQKELDNLEKQAKESSTAHGKPTEIER